MFSISKFICIITFAALLTTVIGSSFQEENSLTRETGQWCDPTLGCLNVTDDWYFITRPINLLPDSRASINTQFLLHTREEPSVGEDIYISADDLTTISDSTFDASRPTKFIIHGFIDTGFRVWLTDMAQYFLSYGDYNVIRVDWGDGSRPMYSQATANTRVVGLEIGYLVNTLKDVYGLDPLDVHLIGHSLGSHISGYAGEQIVNLGRITGMDPAGPYFTATDTFVALDSTDAVFVDAIHTDADSIFMLGWGTAEPMGHLDFYPNSGHDQPGCDPVSIAIDLVTEEFIEAARDVVACSHVRAIEYFDETLFGDPCQWTAHECHDYDSFKAGECQSCDTDNSKCSFLGIRADEYVAKSRTNVLMYSDTDEVPPFCYVHYGISIMTAYPNDAESWVMGRLLISLYGSNGEVISDLQITEDNARIDHGQVSTSLFVSHAYLEQIIMVELEWHYDSQLLNPGTYCGLLCNENLYIDSVEVSPINSYPESERLANTILACSTDGSTTTIEDGEKAEFRGQPFCHPIE